MKITSVFSRTFEKYGRVFTAGIPSEKELLKFLERTPLPLGTEYTAEDSSLQTLPAERYFSDICFGGMPVQLGWCNGHNQKLNCLEYHRSSEFNLGTEPFILLLAKLGDIHDGRLDTSCVKAFLVPKETLIEVYATTLHYAPCDADKRKGFKVLVVLPKGTNTDFRNTECHDGDTELMWARNKWLLAHPESPEAAQGAYIGLCGTNIDLSERKD